jgi:5'-methylthioadenosine nucleosidase
VAVKEMEAAAIAWVCELYSKPLICVKSITDIVDGDRCAPPRVHAPPFVDTVDDNGVPYAAGRRQTVPECTGCPTCAQVACTALPLRRPSQEEFLENLHAAAVALQGALPKVLEFVTGKEVDEL